MLFEEIATGACVGKNDPELALHRKQRQPRAAKTVDQLAAAVVKAIKEHTKRAPESAHSDASPEQRKKGRTKTCPKESVSNAAASDQRPAPPQHPHKRLRALEFTFGGSAQPAELAPATATTPDTALMSATPTPQVHQKRSAGTSSPASVTAAPRLQPTPECARPESGGVTPPTRCFTNGYLLFRSEWKGEGNVTDVWHRLSPDEQNAYKTRCREIRASQTPSTVPKKTEGTVTATRSTAKLCRPLVHFVRLPAEQMHHTPACLVGQTRMRTKTSTDAHSQGHTHTHIHRRCCGCCFWRTHLHKR